jgi:hypothetical protein
MGKTYLQGELLTALDLNNSLNELVNTTGSYTFTGVHTHNAATIFNSNSTYNSNITIGSTALLVSANTIADKIGEVRTVTILPTAGKTLDISDHGKALSASGGITVPSGIFTSGQNVTIFNNTSGNITITQGTGLTLYQAGSSSTGNRTLAQRGISTIVFLDGSYAVIAGTGVS